MQAAVIFRGMLLSDFSIDRRTVVAAIEQEAARLGVPVSFDPRVYRSPAYRTLIETAGITNGVTFCLAPSAPSEPPGQALSRFCGLMGAITRMDVWDHLVLYAFEAPEAGDAPGTVCCAFCDVADRLEEAFARRAEGPAPLRTLFIASP